MSMVETATDLYVYYEVDTARAPALAQRVRAMQAALGRGQLKRRPGDRDGRQTWMEIYLQCSAEQRAAIDAAVSAAGIADLISGERHTEAFIDVDDGVTKDVVAGAIAAAASETVAPCA